jgi:hypothetical protein
MTMVSQSRELIRSTLLNLLQVTTTQSAMVSTKRLIVSLDALIIITTTTIMIGKRLTLP